MLKAISSEQRAFSPDVELTPRLITSEL